METSDLITQNIIIDCTGLLKLGGSLTKRKPEGAFFASILYLNETRHFHSFIKGMPLLRLFTLMHITTEIIKLIEVA